MQVRKKQFRSWEKLIVHPGGAVALIQCDVWPSVIGGTQSSAFKFKVGEGKEEGKKKTANAADEEGRCVRIWFLILGLIVI